VANRLAQATSPYLLQHADNPVDWWEWEPAAFDEARARNVPVLLSVGYAACHWCHVMAHESFEDPDVAAYLNEHFVSIKVDREERPDIDAVYMQATQAMTGQGGWPMTCVLDHDGNPFFAGTYFPDQPRHGQPSFRQLIGAISEAWHENLDQIQQVGAQIRAQLQPLQASVPGERPLDDAALSEITGRLERQYDAARGGFGGAPKFPPSMVLEFLRLRGDAGLVMVDGTLTAMARGGIYDQLGGGFARYSVDGEWVVPHFEKMLYDNAQLVGLYARWGGGLGERVARETAAFMIRELGTAEGGFASALDADSEGVEGRFYVWTPDQLREVLGDEDGAWAAEVFTVTPHGTFEHGSSTLQLLADPDDPVRLADVRRRLLEARASRIRPARDDKVVAAWNGLAISGLVDAGLLLDEPSYVDAALAAARLLRDVHLRDGRLLRVSRDGVAGVHAGVLEDYGCVAAGFLKLVEATADPPWLTLAGELLEVALTRFRADDGGFHDTADDAERLVTRPRDPGDNASPSGLSATVHALTSYAAITGSVAHREAAEAALATVAGLAERAPRFAGWSLAAAAIHMGGPEEIAVVGPAGADRDRLAAAARRRPGAVVVVADGPVEGITLLDARTPVGGRPAAYVCRHHVCAAPVTEVAALRG
jgi:uncharacterized protein YyaL (SSP411 family)